MTIAPNCGLEEPLTENEQILAVNEADGSIQLADFRINRLNRYSVVWSTKEERSAAETFLIRRLFHAFGKKAYWLVGWQHDVSGPQRISSLRFLRKLERAGWQTLSKASLGLGLKAVEESQLFGQHPPEHETLISGWFLWLGVPPSAIDLGSAPFEQTLRMFCKTRELQPSQQFLLAIRDLGLGVVYEATGGSHLPGTIVVIPSDRGSDVRTALEISETTSLKDERAGEVWEGM